MLESPIYKVSDKSVVKERELAEKIFQVFRNTQCRVDHGFMWRNLHSQVFLKLNPKDQELFNRVYVGLQALGYITVDSDGDFIRLTQKGYDYIYEEDKVKALSNIPWIIPDYLEEQDWDKVCKKFIKVGIDGDDFHIPGPAFFSIVSELIDEVPISYSKYIEERRSKEQSTSRKEYYVDLVNLIDKWTKRYELYVRCQEFIENQVLSKFSDEYDIDTTEDKLSFEEEQVATLQNGECTGQGNDIQCDIDTQKSEHPKVFISYSGDSKEHKKWVLDLAIKLRQNGVDVILDQYSLLPGDSLELFMNNSIKDSQKVIMILTPKYKEKSEDMSTGTGYECIIGTAEMRKTPKLYRKYIPVIKEGSDEESIPTPFTGKVYVDMRNDNEESYKKLLRAIYEVPEYVVPPLGEKPDFVQ